MAIIRASGSASGLRFAGLMSNRPVEVFLVLAGLFAATVAAERLSAAEIVARNVVARGGLEAWRKIDTAIWVGHLETGNPAVPFLPFVLEMSTAKRLPRGEPREYVWTRRCVP